MGRWQTVPFEQLYAELSKNGLTRPRRVRGTGYKMVNMGEIFAYDRIRNPVMDLVPMNESEKMKYSLKPGDLLFARQSLVAAGAGKCSIVLETPEITTFESHLIRIQLDPKKAVSLFYYYYFSSPAGKGNVQSLVMQVAAAGIQGSELAKLPVPHPPLPIQRKIAAILSAYDDLIENNTRRIEILEEMARSLYREWFVKFRFPGHEQVQMVNSELGLIPEGWKVISLGEILDIKHGYAFKGEYFSKEPTSNILLTPGNFKFGGGFKDSKFKYYDGLVPDEFVLSTGELLVTMTDLSKEGDTLGYPAFVPPSKNLRFLHNQRLGKIIFHNPCLGLNHLYHIFCSDSYRHHVLASATGATVKHTAPDRIKSFNIALPPSDICNKFETLANLFSRKIVLLNQRNLNLRQTLDLLLPRLISGEIDVENLNINTGEIAA